MDCLHTGEIEQIEIFDIKEIDHWKNQLVV
jgi:hypothetical protein